jgi:Domain of unknown function (DUF4136)
MKKIVFLALAVLSITGCRKEPDLYKLSDDPIVLTKYDPQANFGAFHKFKIVDQIGVITNDPDVDTILDPTYANQLIDKVRENLVARGYTEALLTDSADFGMNISVIRKLSSVDVMYPGYWWGYGGYYDPWYWGCYSCYYYYPYYYSYSYSTGTIMLEFIDLNSEDNNDKYLIRWTGIGNGLLSDYTSTNLTNSLNAIDQMFEQSPYIGHSH